MKLYGERNSGTNYLQQLLAANFRVEQLRGTTPIWFDGPLFGAEWSRDLYFRMTASQNLGWKHTRVPERLCPPADTLLVCLTKNPYSWLLSMFRRPHHAARRYSDFDDFLRSPWMTLGREHSPSVFESPVHMWNAKHASYVQAQQAHGAVLLAYEELVRDPLAVLRRLEVMHGLRASRQPFVNVTASTRREDPERDYTFLRAYYGEERWRSELSSTQLAFVHGALDRAVMQRLGYTLLDP